MHMILCQIDWVWIGALAFIAFIAIEIINSIYKNIKFKAHLNEIMDLDHPLESDGSSSSESDFKVSIEKDLVTCKRPDGKEDSFSWNNLSKIEIMTTSEGP